MKFQRIASEFYGRTWAILPDKLTQMTAFLAHARMGDSLDDDQKAQIQAALSSGPRVTPKTPGNVALIPVYGVISHRMNLMSNFSGGTSVEKLTAQFRQALNDPNVKAIVMDIDSPGGSVDGVPELADEIAAGAKQKKVVAVANTMAASAAYWLACSAGELVCVPSGAVGSIGVFGTHQDVSEAAAKEGVKTTFVSAGKYKVEGNPYEPLSDEARAALQSTVDTFYEMFAKGVAKGRGVKVQAVKDGYGQGRMVTAANALGEGMVDRVETLDQTLARFGVSTQPSSKDGRKFSRAATA